MDTLTPDEAARIHLIECHTCNEKLFTDGLPAREVGAWASGHDHDVEVHFHPGMGLVPNGATR